MTALLNRASCSVVADHARRAGLVLKVVHVVADQRTGGQIVRGSGQLDFARRSPCKRSAASPRTIFARSAASPPLQTPDTRESHVFHG